MFLNRILRAPLAAILMAFAAITLSPTSVLAQASAPTAEATPAPPAVATAPVATVAKESVDNPYGLEALWKGGDIVARTTLIIMIIMSVGTWYIIVTKLLEHFGLLLESALLGVMPVEAEREEGVNTRLATLGFPRGRCPGRCRCTAR